MNKQAESDVRLGVRIPVVGSRRSSTHTGRNIVADSLMRVDVDLAGAAREASSWRKDYIAFLAASTRASVQEKVSVAIAKDGVSSARRNLVMRDADHETPVDDWARHPQQPDTARVLGTRRVSGSGERVRRLQVPYQGQLLQGSSLNRQLITWVDSGVMERGFADAVQVVIDDPDLLSMPGHDVVLLGAGAAMGPLEALSQWGAQVTAVDVAIPTVWERITRIAQRGAGTVTFAVDDTTGAAGVDLAAQLGAIRPWLSARRSDTIPVLGMYAYADGARHVEASVAADVLADDLLQTRPDAVLAYLNTPTDTFLVPRDAIEVAHAKWDERAWNGVVHRTLRSVSGGRMFAKLYAEQLLDDTGAAWGLSDTLVDVQGPNYALAKRLQRWRGVLAREQGHRVSSTVAPASWTQSVVKNRVLASVYAGAHAFGIEIFEPATVAPLLAAKLVADTLGTPLDGTRHPEALFSDAAFHGGLWRQPFESRSALPVAALIGLPARLRAKRVKPGGR